MLQQNLLCGRKAVVVTARFVAALALGFTLGGCSDDGVFAPLEVTELTAIVEVDLPDVPRGYYSGTPVAVAKIGELDPKATDFGFKNFIRQPGDPQKVELPGLAVGDEFVIGLQMGGLGQDVSITEPNMPDFRIGGGTFYPLVADSRSAQFADVSYWIGAEQRSCNKEVGCGEAKRFFAQLMTTAIGSPISATYQFPWQSVYATGTAYTNLVARPMVLVRVKVLGIGHNILVLNGKLEGRFSSWSSPSYWSVPNIRVRVLGGGPLRSIAPTNATL